MKKIVFYLACAGFFAFASPLCSAQGNFKVTGTVQSIENLPILPAWVEVKDLPNTAVQTSGPNSSYTIMVPSPNIYQTLHAYANELWQPQDQSIASEIHFKLERAPGDEGNAGFLQWLNGLLDIVTGNLRDLVLALIAQFTLE